VPYQYILYATRRPKPSPGSNHTSDIPNLRLILNRMAIPIPSFPCSLKENPEMEQGNNPHE
jgi:hypothetical protein